MAVSQQNLLEVNRIMSTISLLELQEKIDKKNLKAIKGTIYRRDIEFDSESNDSFDIFLDFMVQFGVKHVFYELYYFDEFDIENNLIDDEMLSLRRIPDECLHLIKKDVNEHNKKIRKMTVHIGQVVQFIAFFAYEGTTYSYEIENEELLLEGNPKDILESIMEKYENEIDNAREKKYEEHRKIKGENLVKLENELLSNEAFKKCTNIQMRKDFAYGLYFDLELNKDVYITIREVSEVAEKVWRSLKFKALNYNK